MKEKFCTHESLSSTREGCRAPAASTSGGSSRYGERAFPAAASLAALLAALYGCSGSGSEFAPGATSAGPTDPGSSNTGDGTTTTGTGTTTTGTGTTTTGVGDGTTTTGTGTTTTGTGTTTTGTGTTTTGTGTTTTGTGTTTTGTGTTTTGTGGGSATDGNVSAGGSDGTDPVVEAPCPKPAGEICHEFVANDNFFNRVNYVNEFDPSKNWTAQVDVTGVNSPRQAEMVDSADSSSGKAVLVSVNTGFQEYDLVTGDRLLSVTGFSDVRGAVRLPDGTTALGVGNDQLRIVDRAGTTLRSCTLPGAGGDSLRVIQRDPETGNFLFGRLLDVFIANECQQVYTARLPGGSKAYSVFPRVGGGVWATSGATSTIVEFDANGTILGQLGGKDVFPDLGLDFFSGFEILPNGNLVAANWQGHIEAPVDSTPHLVEFTPDNELVWRWGNQTLGRQITNTLMLR